MSKAWTRGIYDCCNGSMKCANNRTKKTVDDLCALYDKDPDEARNRLWNTIANLEEDLEWCKFKRKEAANDKTSD